MSVLPESLASIKFDASASLAPLALVRLGVAFARPVVVCGQSTQHQDGFGRVLRSDSEQPAEARVVWLVILPFLPNAQPSVGRFERRGAFFALTDLARLSSPESKVAPFGGLEVERAAVATLLARRAQAPSPTLDAALAELILCAGRLDEAPSFVWVERAFAELARNAGAAAEEAFGQVISLGGPRLPSALVVRAKLRLDRNELDGADADIHSLAELLTAGYDDDGVPFPANWLALETDYLRACLAHKRGDVEVANPLFEATVADAEQCERDVIPYRQLDSAGAVIAMDIGMTVFLQTTLDPRMTRSDRAASARRQLSLIAHRRGDHTRALEWLAHLETPQDNVAKAKALGALGRQAEALVFLERASQAGLAEATTLLQEARRTAAMSHRPRPTVATSDIDLDVRVRHEKFGLGAVVDFEESGGRPVRVTVAFDDGITRTVPARAVEVPK